jgi:tellurite resistance protein
MYAKAVDFLSVVIHKHTEWKKDMLLNVKLQQSMRNFLESYISFRQKKQVSEMDLVFMSKHIPYFVTVLQYLLVYSQHSEEIVQTAVDIARIDGLFGKGMLSNSFFLREIIRRLSEKQYRVIDLFLAVSLA